MQHWNEKKKHHFPQKSQVNKHIALVHDEIKPFKCEYCDFICNQKSNLNIHTNSIAHFNISYGFENE